MRHLILHNIWLKLFSIALATVIWIGIDNSIHNEKNLNQMLTTDFIRVPIAIETQLGDKRVFRITPSDAIVMAVGKDAASFQNAKKDVHVSVDLTHFDSKEPAMQELKTQTPPGINILEIIPYAVQVQLVSK